MKSLRGEESLLKSYQSLSYSRNTRHFWHPKFRHSFHNNQSLVPIINYMTVIQILTP